eukprot:2580479-Rhodomonas_salina.1
MSSQHIAEKRGLRACFSGFSIFSTILVTGPFPPDLHHQTLQTREPTLSRHDTSDFKTHVASKSRDRAPHCEQTPTFSELEMRLRFQWSIRTMHGESVRDDPKG